MRAQEKGLKKEKLALLGVLVTPVALVVPALMSRQMVSDRPLAPFVSMMLPRLAVGLMLAALVASMPGPLSNSQSGAGSPAEALAPSQADLGLFYYAAMLGCFIAHQACFPNCNRTEAWVQGLGVGGEWSEGVGLLDRVPGAAPTASTSGSNPNRPCTRCCGNRPNVHPLGR